MPTYRCYVLDKVDKISSAVSFEADDDFSALLRGAADRGPLQCVPTRSKELSIGRNVALHYLILVLGSVASTELTSPLCVFVPPAKTYGSYSRTFASLHVKCFRRFFRFQAEAAQSTLGSGSW